MTARRAYNPEPVGDGSGYLLAAGQRLGPYEITRRLGEGGMGEVWQARDTLIGRDVAIKIVAVRFAGDADRVLRFEQEARAAGQLNHPNILTIYAVGREAGSPYLVSELLRGQTLRERLREGPLPPDKALDYAAQIAYGLAAAHAKGIIHRDLKPENLFLTAEGRAKILDFGIAKLTAPVDSPAHPTLANTATGVIVGTIGYMSPEQVRGHPVDARSDLFALGAVLYEMLSGQRAFTGESDIDTLNAILSGEPAPLDGVPPSLERVVRHAIEKEPNARFQSAPDMAFHLEAIRDRTSTVRTGLAGAGASPPERATRWRPVPWVWVASALILGAVAGALAGAGWPRATVAIPTPPLTRLSLPLPAGTLLAPNDWPAAGASVAVSADGRWVAFVAMRDGVRTLGVRSLDSGLMKSLAGTEGAMSPFFSPDERWVGFFTDKELKKVSIDDGTLVTVCATPPVTRGGVWGRDGTIYFSPSFSTGLQRVPASGGVPEDVTQVQFDAGESNHLFPELLPNEETLLFTVWSGGSFKDASVWSLSLRTGERKRLLDSATAARYVPPGFLAFAREGVLFAVRFDAIRATVVGEPFPVVHGVWTDPITGSVHYAVGRDGTLVFAPGEVTAVRRRLVWVDRDGKTVPTKTEPNAYDSFRLSPDGRRLAVGLLNDIWVYDLTTGAWNRATYRGVNQAPVWTPDGRRIAISSSQGVPMPTLFWIAPEGGQPADRLSDEGTVQFPGSWAPGGRRLAYAAERLRASDSGWDIRMLDLDSQPAHSTLVTSPFTDEMPMISPDGRALAYVSDETGQQEVYLRPFPGQGTRIKVSANGGREPLWSPSSGELFFRDGRRMLAARVQTQGQLDVGPPVVLFEGDFLFISGVPGAPTYDVAADGRFLMATRADEEAVPGQLEVMLNWAGELDRRAPQRAP